MMTSGSASTPAEENRLRDALVQRETNLRIRDGVQRVARREASQGLPARYPELRRPMRPLLILALNTGAPWRDVLV